MADFVGGNGVDRFNGTAAADTMTGNAGNDVLNSAGGNDVLDGGDGNDNMNGGSGDDTLTGGAGNDRLTGAVGTDTAIWTSSVGSAASGAASIAVWSGSTLTITTATEGVDIVNTVEFVVFNGRQFEVDIANQNVEALLGADNASGDEDGGSITGNVLSNDYDIDSLLTVTGLMGGTVGTPLAGAHGSLTLNANGTFSYVPNANASGEDVFTYYVTDDGVQKPVTLTITVNDINDDPVAGAVSETIDEDTVLTGTLTATDIDSSGLTFSLATGPTNGVAVVNADGSYTYTPAAHYFGEDSFTYEVDDGEGGVVTATVTVTVDSVNDDPVITPPVGPAPTGDEDESINGQIVAADADGDTLTYGLATGGAPANGVVVIDEDSGAYVYTPDDDWSGTDSFTVEVSDGQGGVDIQTYEVVVEAVNDDPVGEDVTLNYNQGDAITGQVTVSDVDSAPLSVTATDGAHGTVTIDDTGAFTYTPNDPNFFGTDSFDYTIDDGDGGVVTHTVTLEVADIAMTREVGVGYAFATIQDAIDASEDGDIIVVHEGVYTEQLTIDGFNGLTIQAAPGEDVTVLAPAVLAVNGTSGYWGDAVRAVIAVTDSANVDISGLTVDGAYAGDTTPGSNGDELSGIAYLASSGDVSNVTVTNVSNSPAGGLFGLQHGSGIFIDGEGFAGGQPVVSVTDSTVSNFQKSGLLINNAEVTITGNTISGIGATGLTAQNTIQVARSTGEISNNTIEGFGYTGPIYYSSGIIIYEPSGEFAITDNTITGAGPGSAGIDLSDTQGVTIDVSGNAFSALDYGIYAYSYDAGIGLDSAPALDGNSFTGILIEGYHFAPEESYIGGAYFNGAGYTVTGTDQDDNLSGSQGGDDLSGLAGDDVLDGRDGADNLSGGDGEDTLVGGDGADDLDGGDGVDTVDYSGNDSAGVTVNLESGVATSADSGSDTLSDIENVIGTEFNDSLVGGLGENVLSGGDGDDGLNGRSGDDSLNGGAGLDTATVNADLDVADFAFAGGSWTVTGDGADTLNGVERVVDSEGQVFWLVEPGDSIQAVIDGASAGHTIVIAEGVYAENLNVSIEGLTIVGLGEVTLKGTFKSSNGIADNGSVAEWLQTRLMSEGYSPAPGTGLTIQANNVTITNLNIDSYVTGVRVGTSSGVTLNGLDLTDNVTGYVKSTEANVDGLSILGGSVSDGTHGLVFQKTMNNANGTLTNFLIDGTEFFDLNEKGLYFESIAGSTITNVVMHDVGNFGRVPTGGGTVGAFGSAIELNLKNGAYSDVTISDFTLTNVGLSNGGGSTHAAGAAIAVKTRDDAPSYSGAPATWTGDALVITGGVIDGTSTGIHLGEPGKTNAGPPVEVSDVSILNAIHNGVHGDVANQTTSTLTIDLTAGDDAFVADSQSTGAIVINAGDGEDTVTGGGGADQLNGGDGADSLDGAAGADTFDGGLGDDTLTGGAGIDTAEYGVELTVADFSFEVDGVHVAAGAEGEDTLNGVERVIDSEGNVFWLVPEGSSIQAAINAAAEGDTILVGPGVFNEQMTVDGKDLTIIGAGEGLTIIQAPDTMVANYIDANSSRPNKLALVTVKNDADLHISGMTLDGEDGGLQPMSGYDFVGIFIVNSDATVDEMTVVGFRELSGGITSGNQRNHGIMAVSYSNAQGGVGDHTVNITNSSISDVQKTGILAYGSTLTANITGNTITFAPEDGAVIAANGIQLGSIGAFGGTLGTISGNVIVAPVYTGAQVVSPTGMLIYNAGPGVVISDNTISVAEATGGLYDTAIGIYFTTDITVTGNTFAGVDYAVSVYGDAAALTVTHSGNTYNNPGVAIEYYGADFDGPAVFSGEDGADLITGSAFGDTLSGGAGDDTIDAGGGNDLVDGGAGSDALDGGSGYDTAAYGAGVELSDVSFSGSTFSVDDGPGTDSLSNIESLDLDGDEYGLFGGSGANDSLVGDAGTDILAGGDGDDTYTVVGDDIVLENADEGTDTVLSGSDYILGDNLENLTLTDEVANLENFEDFAAGPIGSGENGWSFIGSGKDQTVVDLGGNNAFRMSSDPSIPDFSGPYTPALAGAAGESTTTADFNSFQVTFDFWAADPTGDNSRLEVDLGTASGSDRNNFLVIEATAAGVRIAVADALPDGNFDTGPDINNFAAFTGNRTLIDGLDPAGQYSLTMVLRAVDGPNNDVIDIYLNGALIGTSTTFENYRDALGGTHEDNAEANQVSRLFFRGSAGGAPVDGPGGQNEGFFFDNIAYSAFNAGAGASGTGNALDNVITGNSLDNALAGLAGDDVLNGGVGDDALTGGADDDLLDGGAGIDTAYINADVDDVSVVRDGADLIVTSADGVDILRNIESIVFNGGVTVGLNGGNTILVDGDETAAVTENDTTSGNVLANASDLDGDSLSAIPQSVAGAHGLFTLTADGEWTYEATDDSLAEGDVVTDTLEYEVTDGVNTVSSSLVVTVTGANDAPVADGLTGITTEDNAVVIEVTYTDVDGDEAHVATVDGFMMTELGVAVEGGVVTVNLDGDLVFTPDPGYEGATSFTYTVSDGLVESEPNFVDVIIEGVNDVPVAEAEGPYTLEEGEVLNGQAVATDGDGDDVTFELVSDLDGLTFDEETGAWTFDPAGFPAYDDLNDGDIANLTFSYRATDGTDLSNLIAVQIALHGHTYGNGPDTINGTAGNDTILGRGGDDVINGQAGADYLDGGADDDTISGSDGDDMLIGGNGSDTLSGGENNDTLAGGSGDDALIGGNGADTAVFSSAVVVNLAAGTATGEGTDTLITIERVTGSDFDDVLTGNTAANVLSGGLGADQLNGGDGNDQLFGGAGDDVLNGGAGGDTLMGDAGHDILTGGMGNDTLSGGADNDTFVVLNDSMRLSTLGQSIETDTVLDLSFAAGDRFDLSAIDASIGTAGDQAFTFVAGFTGVQGQATLAYVAAQGLTILRLDVDGDKKADFQARINGDLTGTTGQIVLPSDPDTTGGWIL